MTAVNSSRISAGCPPGLPILKNPHVSAVSAGRQEVEPALAEDTHRGPKEPAAVWAWLGVGRGARQCVLLVRHLPPHLSSAPAPPPAGGGCRTQPRCWCLRPGRPRRSTHASHRHLPETLYLSTPMEVIHLFSSNYLTMCRIATLYFAPNSTSLILPPLPAFLS